MDSVRPLEPEKKFKGGQRAGEAKTNVADQRSCFKCKKTGHIARYCTAVDSTTKRAGAGVVVMTTEVNTAEVRKPGESPTMEVTDDLQSEVEGGMLKLASGKSVPVMTNCAALRDPEKTRSLGLPVLKGQIGGREVDVMRDTGCEGVVVRKQLVDASHLAGECCLLLMIDNTALLAEMCCWLLRQDGQAQKVLCGREGVSPVADGLKKKLLMQWKGPFEIVKTVGINDYRINMGGKEKTFHANLLKGYIARDQDDSQATSSSAIPAASVTVIEDLEGEHFNDSDCEALPELGGWDSEETINDLKYGDELTLDQRSQLEEVALTYSFIFSDRPGTASTEEHCIELT
ncbi:Zinc finger protein [Plakobranchus ocellatus]|uniref:Zinc finger protein n=1 Tax=Plakobranchus ocellatus TaxID=259542 RepID=A0AAV4BKP4_9GAST|nr:Zinc finger protein [Plakobranchus ocellatus]